MPETKLSTADYLPLFASWRKAHFDATDSSWSATGKDFLSMVNAEIKKEGNRPYADSKEGFDDLRAKHNTTRAKLRDSRVKPIDMAFNVTEYISHGVGRRKTPNLSHLDGDERTKYMDARRMVDNYIASKMPGLPSYEVATRGGLTVEQMMKLLE